MEFEFAKYTEITELYKKHSLSLQDGDGYIRFFICPDVHTFWLARVIEGFNESYEKEEGSFLIERNNIEKKDRSEKLTKQKVVDIIEDDDFSNWDIYECQSMEEVIDILDDGNGIVEE